MADHPEIGATLAEISASVRERRLDDLVPRIDKLLELHPLADPGLHEACRKLARWFVEAHAGRFGHGLNEAVEAFEQLRHAGAGEQIAWAESPLGFGMGFVGNLESGLAWIENVISRARQAGDDQALKSALSNKGALLSLAGDQPRAVEVYLECLPLPVAGGSDHEVRHLILLNNLAFALVRWARSLETTDPRRCELARRALTHADDAVSQAPAQALGGARWRGWGLSNRAGALALLGRREEAESAYREALPLSVDNLRVHLLAMAGLGGLLAEVGLFEEARTLLQEAHARAPADLLDSTLDFVMEERVRLEVLAGRGDDALSWSSRRFKRLQEQSGTRVRNALQQLERLKALEHEQQQERSRAEAAVRAAREREREDLLQDLHDGFGSQLVGARLRAERGDLTQDDMTELLQDCVADLYLVVDTLANDEGSLADAMRFMRHRYDSRMAGQPVSLHWSIESEGLPAMPSRQTIQVLRIVQEALANALKHARARNICISMEGCLPQGTLRVRVDDDGQGLPASLEEGHGVRSMRSRAGGLGAKLAFLPNQPGTRVELLLPLALPLHFPPPPAS